MKVARDLGRSCIGIDLNPEYSYYSPYLEKKEGSNVVTVRYGRRRWEYDFGESTITETTE